MMLRFLWKAMWEDLGYEAPHPGRCLIYVAAALLVSLGLWAALILWLAALA